MTLNNIVIFAFGYVVQFLSAFLTTMFSNLIAVIILTLTLRVQTEECRTPNNKPGACIYLHSCSVFFEMTQKGSLGDEIIKKSICGGTKYNPKVCCGLQPIVTQSDIASRTSVLPSRMYCGYQHSDDYFRQENDNSVRITEFPWLAHLLYKHKKTGEEDFRCAGSLINGRYVLTAAHCLKNTGQFQIVGVRLGEYYYNNQSDCVQEPPYDQECSDVQNYGINKIIPHPNFNNKHHNDIGLIRLNRTVEYSDYIRPICLPQPGLTLAKVNDTLTSSGWGKTKNESRKSLKKKSWNILISNEKCAHNYGNFATIIENQFCTVSTPNNMDLQCTYDSGGPVMFPNALQWHQEGIVSFGPKSCGTRPDVSTRVANYVSWIEENLE